MSEERNQPPTDPISAVGMVTSFSKTPEGFYVDSSDSSSLILSRKFQSLPPDDERGGLEEETREESSQQVAKTTDGSDADLWKDGLFKSKVTRYLCFSRKTGPEVVVDMKVIDFKDPLPEFFTPVQETIDTKEAAMRKRRICVKMSPREAAETAVCDIQITVKSKYHLVNYTCIGEINNMGVWYRMGDVPRRPTSQETRSASKTDTALSTTSRGPVSRPQYEQQSSGSHTMAALDGVPFVISEKFYSRPQEMQQVNLMGITIKSLAEIEEEFQYVFSTERSIMQ